MKIDANMKTAAVTGAWAGFCIPLFEAWYGLQQFSSSFTSTLVLIVMAALVLVPLQFFVFGRQAPPSRAFKLDSHEGRLYMSMLKRILVCGVVAAAVLLAWRLYQQ